MGIDSARLQLDYAVVRDSPRFRHRFDRAMNSPRVLHTRRRRSPRGRDRGGPLDPRAIPDGQRQTANMTTQPGLRSSGKTGPETLGGQHPKAWLAQERADPRRLEFLCWAQATRPTFKDRSSVAQQHVMREGPGGLTGRAGALLPRAASLVRSGLAVFGVRSATPLVRRQP